MIPYQRAEVSFKKIQEIGPDGQNSKVYIVHDEHLDAELVIKEIDKAEGFSKNDFFEEARNLYSSSHPNVVQISYACEDVDKIYLASPYYSNGSLKDIMRSRYLTAREIIRYSTHILNGLHNVHSKGLIHFDIKPDNILISDRNEALVSDFGLTKATNALGEAVQKKLYVKQYPIEVFRGTHTYDYRFDIYQIGLLMYRMCVGDNEFDEQYKMKVNSWDDFVEVLSKKSFPDRKAYPKHIPKKLQTIINKCLNPDILLRYQSCIEIVNAMSDIDGPILDWLYSKENEVEIWKETQKESPKVIKLCNNETCEAFIEYADGKTRRITALCKDNIKGKEVISFLENGK